MKITTQIQKALAKVLGCVSEVSYTNSSVGTPVAFNDNAVRKKHGGSPYTG